MKKQILVIIAFAAMSFNAQAFWGGNNNFFGSNGSGSNWPAWTPMYWMEEFVGNNDYDNYYGNANPWGAGPMNGNPWSNGPMNMNAGNFAPNGYSPYIGGGPNAGYPQGYPQGYRPLSGYQNMPLAPSRGPTSIRP